MGRQYAKNTSEEAFLLACNTFLSSTDSIDLDLLGDPLINLRVSDIDGTICANTVVVRSRIRKLHGRLLKWVADPQEGPDKLIFLDVDGVLNHQGQHTGLDHRVDTPSGVVSAGCVRLLNHITDETGAKLVLSSTWRKDSRFDAIESLKKGGVTGEFIGTTGSGGDMSCRGGEIERWLRDNEFSHFYDNYIILDDDNDMLLSQAGNYLHVDPAVGLTHNTAYRAINKLGKLKAKT